MDFFLAASEGFSFASQTAILIFLAGIILFAAISVLSKQSQWGVPTAAAYLGIGVVVAIVLHLLNIPGINPLKSDARLMEHLSEFITVVALFVSGFKIKRSFSLKKWSTPILLVVAVMPLTILLVALFANLIIGLSVGAAIMLGAILAPTDPVLAGEVGVEEVGEGDDEEHRFALSAESGLNDGLAFPFVFLAIFFASGEKDWLLEWFTADVVYAISAGVLTGLLLGVVLRKVVSLLSQKDMISDQQQGWLVVASIFIVYGATEIIGAYGFLAVFFAALAYTKRIGEDLDHYKALSSDGESLERVFELVLMVLIGSLLTLKGLSEPGILGWALVFALIFLIRPALVFLVFLKSKLNMREKAFLGWLGIRGLGSIYYLEIAAQADVFSKSEMDLIFWIAISTVVASVLIHGLTAAPLTEKLHLHKNSVKRD